ncbi:uncharacterized protein LOC107611437 [Arachis ipaensis]|uniref:uncharacterized protein LOC107611437 n=1 Tax=Arachis ipaensis TaxID=130454 RepID=UPI0007AF8426|nr:uncharacterized protein LOC107611437 [Arachis ipaensis]
MKKEETHVAKESEEEKTREKVGSILLHAPLVAQEPEVPHPQKLQKETKDEQFTQFLEICKKLHINIPFSEVLEKMPPYMAVMKGFLSEKKALNGDETVVLTKEYSALIQRKLPKKMPDLGSFFIPYTSGTITFEKALCDLGSSINLMPLSAYGLVENVPVKAGELFLPADFVMLDMEEDTDDSIILGRPFLATGRALINVERGEMVLRLHEDYMIFNVFKLSPLSDKEATCIQNSVLKPSHLVKRHTVFPDIKPKFGVGHSPPTKEERGSKKKVPKGWRNKKIFTEDFSPGMKVVFARSLVLPHTMNRILSFEHTELIHDNTGKKFTMRGEDLSLYDYLPP